jgi:molecular chaperone HtpG
MLRCYFIKHRRIYKGFRVFQKTFTPTSVGFACSRFSHNEDAVTILELDKNYLCGPDTVACLPLVAVVLRLSDLLDFDGKRTPAVLFSHLLVRHPVSMSEWNKHRAVEAWSITPTSIQFHAKCKHPAIQASIHAFCDIIDNELSLCNNIISALNDFHRNNGRTIHLSIPLKVDRSKIETKKTLLGKPEFLYRETQFTLSKTQVIDLLMGTKLYGDPQVALRELIQNSIDACLLRRALEAKWNNAYAPEILIRYYTENNEDILEIIDNGTGMDQDIVDSYYSKIGSSFYKSSEFYKLKSESGATFTPTSRFGIGILSCFMVADSLVVDTRRVYGPHDSSEPINITIEGQESIFWIRPGGRQTPGTSTKLFLRKTNPWARMNEDQFIKAAEAVVPNPPFKILIETESHKKTRDENSFREMRAESLKNYSWEVHENIREYKVEFSDVRKGFVGSAIVAILESHGHPVGEIAMASRTVKIDGVEYQLGKSLKLGSKSIGLSTTSITINDEGEIDQSDSRTELASARSCLSLHGIDVPATLFPNQWEMDNHRVKINWPFPVLLVIDICGDRDLDLNSSRSQLIMSEKWIKLEEDLAFEICSRIAEEVSAEYWNSLKDVLIDNTKNQVFIDCMNRVACKDG